jgi:hypothetical protein
MSVSIEQANDAKRQLLAQNDGVKGLPPIKSVVVVLGDDGFRLEAVWRGIYKRLPQQTEINGVPIRWTEG